MRWEASTLPQPFARATNYFAMCPAIMPAAKQIVTGVWIPPSHEVFEVTFTGPLGIEIGVEKDKKSKKSRYAHVVVVKGVNDGAPPCTAAVRVGDVITKLNGKPLVADTLARAGRQIGEASRPLVVAFQRKVVAAPAAGGGGRGGKVTPLSSIRRS